MTNQLYLTSQRLRTCFALVVFFAIVSPLRAADTKPEGPVGIVFFEKKIRPVLVAHCYECHAETSDEVAGGLLLDTREGIRRGGDTGRSIVPKRISESLLMDAIRHESFEMPPDQDRLSDEVIADFEKWINMGAPDPREGTGKLPDRSADQEAADNHWAYQPLSRAKPLQVEDDAWPRGTIDEFILSKLEAAEIVPASDANRYTLLRRATYDLTGLPPTHQEIQDFISDKDSDAFDRVVDRLLKSKQFGERWGRHWLDVARYADSSGGGRDNTYADAWRYRDYVIESFNTDKPYRQFLTEQVAGDLLPYATDQQQHEQIVATGFLVVGPKNLGERNKEKTRMDVVDEQIDTVGRAFLGLTLGCARCHKHKFDPVSSADYYGLAGIFSSTRTLRTPKPTDAASFLKGVFLPIDKNEGKALDKAFATKRAEALTKKEQKLGRVEELEEQQKELLGQQDSDSKTTLKKLEKQLVKARLEADVASGDHSALYNYTSARPKALAVSEMEKPSDENIRIRGQVDSKGPVVPRGFLSVLSTEYDCTIPAEDSGRLQLAKWMVDPESPASALSSRVIVNRIWNNLFGVGIVRTTDNFGIQGETPSHPALLDYLANRFAEQGWSVKQMIREIMRSRVYQLAAEQQELAARIDPDNRLLWRTNGRRMDVESIRDSILTISGLLDPVRGGPTLTVAGTLGSSRRGFRIIDIDPYSRRGVYLPIIRSGLSSSMDMYNVFDFPDSGLVTGQRNSTTVPTQALYLMNSPFIIKNARNTVTRLLADTSIGDDSSRVRWMFLTMLGRPATATDTEDSLRFIEAFRKELLRQGGNERAATEAAWAIFCQSLFASNEFLFLN